MFFSFLMWHEYKRRDQVNLTAVFGLFILGVIVSHLLSVQLNTEVRYDLRGVPLLIAGLYFGNPFSLLLYIGMVVVRAFFGINIGFFMSTLVYGIQVMMMALFFKNFRQQTLRVKVLVSIALSVFTCILFVIGTFLLNLRMSFFEWTLYIFLFSLGAAMFTIAIEAWKSHLFMRRQMIKTEKIEAVSQLAASISHEVRNPLTTVKGILQLLKEDKCNQESLEFITLAIDEVNRANGIINDYLSFAKPSIDKIETIDVEKELMKAINIIRPLSLMNNIEIHANLSKNLFILGSVQQLHQCIHNMLKNAVEAMPQGGTLIIGASLRGERVQILISDTGFGMSEMQVQKLGEPYFSTKGAGGTGLGLMISFGIIRAMKGTTKVTSIEGQGTTISMRFKAV